jgi:hypothetical protein
MTVLVGGDVCVKVRDETEFVHARERATPSASEQASEREKVSE